MPRQTAAALGSRSAHHRWLDIGVVALASLSVFLCGAAAVTFGTVRDRQHLLSQTVREDAVWAAYQIDSEAKKLRLALTAPLTYQSANDIALRYDILFSRAALLSGQNYVRTFARVDLGGLAAAVRSRIVGLSSHFDPLRSADGLDTLDIRALQKAASDASTAAEQFLNQANLSLMRLRAEERDSASRSLDRFGLVVGSLIAALAVIVFYLASQLRQIRSSRNKLASLSIERAQAAERAEAGARAKSIFLATMSHEIRTPLNGIIGTVDLLRDSSMSPDQQRKLTVVAECSDTLLALIDDILDFTKLEAGPVEFEKVPVRISHVIGSVLETVRHRAEAKDLTLNLDCQFDGVVRSDPTRLRQILFNLIGNAVKFTAQGEIKIDCRVEVGELVVEISDTGIGVPAEMRDRLFKNFSQVDVTINRRFGGSGLGLAICHRIVTGLHGRIGVRELEPNGSCFWFRVPVEIAPNDVGPSSAQQSLDMRSGRLSGRVLLAEDNNINRTVAVEMLHRLGVTVATAADGEEAIRMALATPFSAILMDVQMPGTDGLTATQMLRQSGCDTPIIALTSNALSSDRAACLDSGMNDFIAKPINRAKIEAALRPWLTVSTQTTSLDPVNAANSAIDFSVRATLEEDLGQPLLTELTNDFWKDASEAIERAKKLVAEGNTRETLRELHALKGVSGTLGMALISTTIQALECGLRESRAVDLTVLDRDLTASLAELKSRTSLSQDVLVSA
ncbi:ATP-binding protein [Bosea sp. CCNWLW174]|uniref:ATP-binding protein n=1 Tax=unclassified Bosea (in: a-proteobacteria) TaxID=2653178 RepID=UPI003014E53D